MYRLKVNRKRRIHFRRSYSSKFLLSFIVDDTKLCYLDYFTNNITVTRSLAVAIC